MTDGETTPAETDQSTGERLLAGAAVLFREQGYAGTTTRQLAALVGIQNASLYHHVGGKEDLLYRLCMDTLDSVAATFTSAVAAGTDPLETLGTVARGYLDQALNDRDRHATMLTEIRSLSPQRQAEVIGRRDKNVAIVQELVAKAQRAGQVRKDIDAKYLTLALFNLLNWSIFWFNPEGELDHTAIGNLLWTVFSDGAAKGDSKRKR
ncbi:TetR/AcrR family transcriptional regulator [Jatrophihabitans sp.]|uniref:TetR/AcrR family transcriptional regulator n=1 Tax=Jatrophihabitans sp. TaxID=1932789 RepID=UPI0030C6B9EB|nr:transcriptional regulator, TetR family [Jatrophihabitans sp.]